MAKMGGIRKANGKMIFRLHLVSIPILSNSCQFQSLHLAGLSEAPANHPTRRPTQHRANPPNPCTTGPDFPGNGHLRVQESLGLTAQAQHSQASLRLPVVTRMGSLRRQSGLSCLHLCSASKCSLASRRPGGCKDPALLSGLQSVQITMSSC